MIWDLKAQLAFETSADVAPIMAISVKFATFSEGKFSPFFRRCQISLPFQKPLNIQVFAFKLQRASSTVSKIKARLNFRLKNKKNYT